MSPRDSAIPPATGINPPPTSVTSTASSIWNQAISEYIALLKLSPEEKKALLEARTTNQVVTSAIQTESKKRLWKSSKPCPHRIFIAAVVSARTHEDLVKELKILKPNKVPEVVTTQIATFLRYADAFDAFLDALGNTTFASPVIFGAIRYMLIIAVKNVNLLNAVKGQFEDINLRLHRLNIYLTTVNDPTESVRLMCIRALVNILRFCGLATKYFSSIDVSSISLKSRLEEVIRDLDRDTMIEIAAGVAQLNFTVEKVRGGLESTKIETKPETTNTEETRLLAYERATKAPIFSVLYDSPNAHFIGRESLLTSLRSLLREAKPLRYNHCVALFGMGGAGKTELAMEYAHRYKTDYHFVFSLPAESRLALISGYVTIAQQTHCVPVPAKASPDGVAKSVLQWLQAQTTKSWLIILDNLDEITDAKGLLPIGNEHHHTIITTRDINVFGIPAEGLPVAEMDENDAIQLLLLECGPIVESEPDAAVYAKEIVQVLGSLPLAIHHAAAFIRGTGNIAAFCSTFRKSHKDMMNKRPHGNYPYENSVTAAFQLCFQDKRLREEAPSSIRLVEMLAFLNADVLLDFLESGSAGLSPELKAILDDQFSFAEALRGLQVFSLIKTTKGGRQISMHRLVQHIVRDNLQTEGNYIARFDDCIALCTAAFPYLSNPDSPDFRVTRDGVPSWDSASRERFRLFVPQIMPCLECYEGEGSATFARLLEDLAYFLRDEGFYDVSIQLWERSLAVRSRLGGPVHLDTLASKYGLAVSLGRNGKMEPASVLLEEVYEGRTKILGATHPDTLWSLHVLAWSYRVNRIHEAATLFEKALESQTATLGSKHTDTLRTKHALAVVYDRLGRTAEAAQLLQETFHTQLEVLGTDDPDTVRSKNGLAFAFGHLRRFDEAAVLFEELMEERIKRLGSEHIDTLWTKHGLACAYAGLGRMKEAKLLLEEILVLQSRTLGADHPMTLSTKHCLSAVFRNLGLDTEGNEEDARSMAAVKSAGSFLVT